MDVDTATAALERHRSLTLSTAAFRRIAIAATGMLVLILATGATVRLTGSGLGCEHWPGCQPGDPFPKKGYHSDVEFSNRIVASLTVLTTLALAVGALRTVGLRRNVKVLAAIVFAGTLAQAPLGAITVYYHLDPYLVIVHLLLSLVVLGLAVLTLLEVTRTVRGRGDALPSRARAAGVVLSLAVTFLVVTGTFATAAGKFPGSSGDKRVHRLGSFDPSVSLHVKAVATFGVVFLLIAGWAWANRARHPWLLRGCAGLLGILAVQMALGEVQFRLYDRIPWPVVLVHVVVAGCLFAWTVGLVARLWRPVAT